MGPELQPHICPESPLQEAAGTQGVIQAGLSSVPNWVIKSKVKLHLALPAPSGADSPPRVENNQYHKEMDPQNPKKYHWS